MQMILRPQGGTNVFTAINLFKIGATAPAVTSSPLWAPISKRLIAVTPHPTPPQQKYIRTNDPQAPGWHTRVYRNQPF